MSEGIVDGENGESTEEDMLSTEEGLERLR